MPGAPPGASDTSETSGASWLHASINLESREFLFARYDPVNNTWRYRLSGRLPASVFVPAAAPAASPTSASVTRGGEFTLGLRVEGQRLTLSLNGTSVAEIIDPEHQASLVGLLVSTTETSGPATAVWSDLSSTRLAPPAALVLNRLREVPRSWNQNTQPSSAGPFKKGTIVSLHRTPHLWVADQEGVLHWIGDMRGFYSSEFVKLAGDGFQADTSGVRELSLGELGAARRGAPWLTATFVQLGDTVYVPQWALGEAAPVLQQVQSPSDLALFGVTPADASALVLSQAAWESRYGLRVDDLLRSELRRASGPLQPHAPCLPAAVVASLDDHGATISLGNDCGGPLQTRVSAVVYEHEHGQPLATTLSRTQVLENGVSQTVRLDFDPRGGTWVVPLIDAAPPVPADVVSDFVCLEVGGEVCLESDPMLRGAVDTLMTTELGRPLLASAANHGMALIREPQEGTYGRFDPTVRTVSVSTQLDYYSDWERALVLSHELQHAADYGAGRSHRNASECYAWEIDAFQTESAFWRYIWQGTLPEPQSKLQAENNRLALIAMEDPTRFESDLLDLYHRECSRYDRPGVGVGVADR